MLLAAICRCPCCQHHRCLAHSRSVLLGESEALDHDAGCLTILMPSRLQGLRKLPTQHL